MEDLHGWKDALEEAISSSPNPNALVMGQNGISNAADVTSEPLKDRQIVKSLVIGGPILLALEDIDGTPSFLEKALSFLEEHGVKTEGVLRQAADVDDVERRIQEYEKGKTDFSPEEDPHVIGDCIKYVLRELPSSPVPASCCKALLEAFRTERTMRIKAMRSAICETFPEPNRRLLQRILTMMQTVASHKAENRMSVSAVAACMAPLLLRPLLAGDCELENNDFGAGCDNSVQLLQAAAAANHAQAIVIILLEEYDNVFGDGAASHEPYTDSEESGSESEEMTDDDYDDEDDDDGSFDDDGDDYSTEGSATDDHELSPISNTEPGPAENLHDKKVSESQSVVVESPQDVKTSLLQHDSTERTTENVPNPVGNNDDAKIEPNELLGADADEKAFEVSRDTVRSCSRRPTVWGRTPGRKNLSMESVELPLEDEAEIHKLESVEEDSRGIVSTEAEENLLLQDSIQRRKQDLQELRLVLGKDVARLQEQLQKEMELRTELEAGLKISQLPPSASSLVDDKMKAELDDIAQAEADVMNLNQKTDDLESQLNHQREENSRIRHDILNQLLQDMSHQLNSNEKQMDGGLLPIPSSENVPRSKQESILEKPDSDKDKKQETQSSLNKPLPDAVKNQKATGVVTSTSTKKLATTGSKKSSTRAEERRTQIASELNSLDRGRNSTDKPTPQDSSKPQSSSENGQNIDKGTKSSEGQSNLERGKSERTNSR